jgi:hypothetical protein
MQFEELAKENEGRKATDEEFAAAVGLTFFVDGEREKTITIAGENNSSHSRGALLMGPASPCLRL